MHQSHIKQKSSIPLCPMCRNQFDSYYRIPRVIPKCGHTFCQKCINMHIITKSNRKLFICPNCQSETIIRKGITEDIPKNIQILDITKSIKKKQYEDMSPINNNNQKYYSNNIIHTNNFTQSSTQTHHNNNNDPLIYCPQHPSKQMDLICQTCNYQHVCSTCVLLTKNHQQHKFVQFIPASSTDLSQLQQIFTIIEDSVKQTILPSANFNIIKKSQEKIILSTILTIQKYFKENYFKVIQKKQQELIKQCKQIQLQLPLYNKIQQITKIYDLLKDQYDEIKLFNDHKNKNKKISLDVIEGFIKKCKELHHQIENFSEYSQKQCDKILKDITNKIEQTQFVKINEVNNTLKNVLAIKSNNINNINNNNNINININNPPSSIPNKHQKYTNSLIKSPQRLKTDTRSVHQMRTTSNNNNFNTNTNNFANININKKSLNQINSSYQQNDLNDFDIHNQFDQIRSVGNTKSYIVQNNNKNKQKQKQKQKQMNFNVKSNKASSNSNICMPPKCNNNNNNKNNNFNNNNNNNNLNNNNNNNNTSKQFEQIPTLQLNLPQSKSIKIARTTTSNTDRIINKKQVIPQNKKKQQKSKSKNNYNNNIIIIDKKSPYKSNSTINQLKTQHQITNSSQNNSLIQAFTSQSNIPLSSYQPSSYHIKQIRPTKQLPLNLKSKYNSILTQITRQSTSTSLELISMEINDNLIIYLCQYLRGKKIKFQMIKLVKNQITDEGFSILLGYLVNDDITQVLNLTSNQITLKRQKNKMLKTIYLGNNKISSIHVKQKKKQLENVGIDIII